MLFLWELKNSSRIFIKLKIILKELMDKEVANIEEFPEMYVDL